MYDSYKWEPNADASTNPDPNINPIPLVLSPAPSELSLLTIAAAIVRTAFDPSTP